MSDDKNQPPRSTADKWYGSTQTLVSAYGPALADTLHHIGDATGLDRAALDAHLRDTVEVFRDAQIEPQVASRLHALIARHIAKPADDATRQTWATEARRSLRQTYGADAERRMDVATQFVSARPGLHQLLNQTGLGSHPEVIMALAERTSQLRVAPTPPGTSLDGDGEGR